MNRGHWGLPSGVLTRIFLRTLGLKESWDLVAGKVVEV